MCRVSTKYASETLSISHLFTCFMKIEPPISAQPTVQQPIQTKATTESRIAPMGESPLAQLVPFDLQPNETMDDMAKSLITLAKVTRMTTHALRRSNEVLENLNLFLPLP